MREAFTEESVRAMFKLALTGLSGGLDVHARICRETTLERTFAELVLPLVVMAVDLDAREPVPLTDGPVWQALLAATALPGMFPPHQLGGRRLVDSLCLVPVPTEAAREAGADIVLAVNLLSRETLPAWPGEAQPAAPPPRSGVRMLDTLLEVMDLSQLDASERHTAMADVAVNPRFGPCTWRDFDRADRVLAAGRAAALEQLPILGTLARPQGRAVAISRQ
jgi:NTE family protein